MSPVNASSSGRLRVVHMTSVHTPFDPRIFHKECRSLARAGFDVTVLGANWKSGQRDSVSVVSIDSNSSRLRRMTQTAWAMYREARHQAADIYHFHDPELIPLGLLLRIAGKQVIYDIHEDIPKEILSKRYLPSWSRKLISRLVQSIEGFAARRFSALVVVTPSINKRFQPINPRTIIIYNYPYVRELMDAGQAIPWESRDNSVAYVGGLTLQRAIREMVEAMALLPSSLDTKLDLAGPEIEGDANFTELRRHPGWTRVRHHGFIDQKSTFQILQKVRAGLVLYHPEPNQVESIPQKIFEYMAAGIPVIASDFPLWRDIIGGAGCGFFVNPAEPAEIAHAIEFVMSHPTEAQEMGRLGQAAVLQRFNWDSEVVKLVQLYRTLGAEIRSHASAAPIPSTN